MTNKESLREKFGVWISIQSSELGLVSDIQINRIFDFFWNEIQKREEGLFNKEHVRTTTKKK